MEMHMIYGDIRKDHAEGDAKEFVESFIGMADIVFTRAADVTGKSLYGPEEYVLLRQNVNGNQVEKNSECYSVGRGLNAANEWMISRLKYEIEKTRSVGEGFSAGITFVNCDKRSLSEGGSVVVSALLGITRGETHRGIEYRVMNGIDG